MARIFLIRHPETTFNNPAEERIRSLKDIPLDAHGEAEAKELTKLTRGLNPRAIYTSPLQRAKVTAEAIAKVHRVPVIELQHLLPWDLGEYIGRLVSEVHRDITRLTVETPNVAPKGGESFQHWFDNWQKTLIVMMEEAEELEDEGVDLIALTHYRNVRAAVAMTKAGMKPHQFDKKVMMEKGPNDPASITTLIGRGDKWVAMPPIKMKSSRSGEGKKVGS